MATKYYATADGGIRAVYDSGREVFAPPGSSMFWRWKNGSEDGGPVTLENSPPTLPTPDQVRAECKRRITERFSLEDQLNMQADGTTLLMIGSATWNTAQKATAADLQTAWKWIKQMRAASNTMEAQPVSDYTSDARWPKFGV